MLAQGLGQPYANPTGERSEALKLLNRQVTILALQEPSLILLRPSFSQHVSCIRAH